MAYETLIDPDRRRATTRPGRQSRPSAAVVGRLRGVRLLGRGQRRRAGVHLRRPVRRRLPPGGGAAAGAGRERGADLHADLAAHLRRGACAAAPRPVTVTRSERCRACGGAGILRGSDDAVPAVRRRGVGPLGARAHGVLEALSALRRHRAGRRVRLPRVRGRGHRGAVRGGRRADSGGHRRPWPALRVAGKGNAGRRGGAAGDLYVDRPRRGRTRSSAARATTCTSIVPVAVHEAALGARIDVPDAGRALRGCACRRARSRDSGSGCAAAACRSARRRRAGDLVVEVRLVLPQVLDERSKELLREFGQAQTEDVRATLFREAGRPSGSWSRRRGRTVPREPGEPMATKRPLGKAYYMISAVAQEVPHPPADAAALRARGAAQAVAHRGQHAPLLGGGPRAARDHPLADARSRREPRRRGDHPQHAPEDGADAARGQRVHGVREARAGARPRTTGSSGSARRWSSRRRPTSSGCRASRAPTGAAAPAAAPEPAQRHHARQAGPDPLTCVASRAAAHATLPAFPSRAVE